MIADATPTRPTRRVFRDEAAKPMVIAAARRNWLGDLAREVGLEHLLDGIYDFPDEIEREIFRAHHARAVCTASPVALDAAEYAELRPDALVEALDPDGDWPTWVCGPRPLGAARHLQRSRRLAYNGTAQPDQDRATFLHGGFVVRGWEDKRGALGVRLSPAGLEVGVRLFGGLVRLRTDGDLAMLVTPVRFPDVVRAAVEGRPVEDVFDHPVLRGRGYVVSSARDVACFDDGVPSWQVEFRAERTPWRVPWVRDDREAGLDSAAMGPVSDLIAPFAPGNGSWIWRYSADGRRIGRAHGEAAAQAGDAS